MNLFSDVVPENQQHPNYVAIKDASVYGCEHRVLRAWAEGFVDRDRKFVKEFQTTFNSGFWELYIHAVLKEYAFRIDFAHDRPDFVIAGPFEFVIEAVTANAACDKPAEWETRLDASALLSMNLNSLNREAIIRASNAIDGKVRKYREHYCNLDHVRDRPFVLALATFDQPYFHLEYNRAILAALYDYYVDEEQTVSGRLVFNIPVPAYPLGTVTKPSGASVELGVFSDSRCEDISAVIFSCTATWGKVRALAKNEGQHVGFRAVRLDSTGRPYAVGAWKDQYEETLLDGLQIYHNPYARHPLPFDLLKADGVVQHYWDPGAHLWVVEGIEKSLAWRMCMGVGRASKI
ncbi:hypothetical protein [Anaerobaca lacustris]|uniref:Glycosaminoglycan attachment site n=1 Tax=Anaerobaca lacustris TaxID=3044600 RepID=A0AAW6U0Q6_9BACT|nr:hypothetical protein [Sedimentisphaerales bacterium M17dextr]